MSNKKSNTSKPKRRIFIVRRTIAVVLVIGVIVACLVATTLFTDMRAMINERPELDLNRFETAESSRIFDASGALIAEIGNKLSDNITFDEMPSSLVDAFVAIEDSRFFEHDGFDISRFVAALIGNIRSGDLFSTGASTLTMQVVKNTFFVSEESQADVTLERKVQEISMALDIEDELSKEEILEYYLNKINFNVPESIGIGKAAVFYFGKEVNELTLSESAYLAGMINAPSYYNAFKNINAATERRNEVLDLMVRHGYITNEENQIARSIRLEDQLVDNLDYAGNDYIYSDYIDTVINEVTDLTGVSPISVGMDIYTALIPEQQQTLEAIQNGDVQEFYNDKVQIATTVINNQTGEIIAIGGGRPGEEQVRRGLNRATSSYRQPGSSLKPVLSYALAFEYLGWSTEHIIEDGPYAYTGGPFVNNYSRRFSGDIALTDAVAASLNIPAIKTLEAVNSQIGYNGIVNYLKGLGFDETVAENYSLGYAIGSAAFEVTPVELAAAHGTIINSGNYIKPHTVKRIEIKDQEPIIPTYAETSIISEQAAYLAAYTMDQAVRGRPYGGTAITRFRGRGYPVYAKSGTTDHDDTFVNVGIPEGATKDSWMAVSTNEYSLSIWYGYDDAREGDYVPDSNVAAAFIAGMGNTILDSLENIHTPTAIARPGGISDITRIQGVYPYSRPIEGMDQSLVITDMIKSEFAVLTDYEAPELNNLQTQAIETGNLFFGGLKVNVTMSPYPDPEALEVAEPVKELSATDMNGRVMTREVKSIFHPSWIYGAVRYATDIKVNGEVVETIIDDKNAREFDLRGIQSNQNIEICSYYRWENNDDIRSNEVCEVINSGQSTSVMPRFVGLSRNEFETWLSQNSTLATVEYRTVDSTNANQIGTIASVSPDHSNNNNLTQEQLDSSRFTVNIYDKTINFSDIVGQTAQQVNNQFGPWITLSANEPVTGDKVVASVGLDGQSVQVSTLTKSGNKYVLPVTLE